MKGRPVDCGGTLNWINCIITRLLRDCKPPTMPKFQPSDKWSRIPIRMHICRVEIYPHISFLHTHVSYSPCFWENVFVWTALEKNKPQTALGESRQQTDRQQHLIMLPVISGGLTSVSTWLMIAALADNVHSKPVATSQPVQR